MKNKYMEDVNVGCGYNPTLDHHSSINDFIDRYKIIPRITVMISSAIFIYCIYSNKPIEVIEFTGYIYSLFVLLYVVGIDSLKDILDWYVKVLKIKRDLPETNRDYNTSKDDFSKPIY